MNLPRSSFSFIFYFARQQWIKFSIMIFVAFVWALNDSFFPYFLKRIVNILESYQGTEPWGVFLAVKNILILLVIFWLVTEALHRTLGIVQIYALPQLRATIREAVFNYVKQHSHEYFANNFAGNIAKRLNDLPNSCQTVVEIVCFQFVTPITGAIVVLIMMWAINPLFAMILLIWLCSHLGLTILLLRRTNKLWEVHSNSVSTLTGKIVDSFTNMLNVRLFARGQYESEYLKTYQSDEIFKAKKAMWVVELLNFGLGLSGLFLIFGMVFTLLYGFSQGWVTLGDFTQVGMQTLWLLGWIWFLSYQLTVVSRELGTISDALTLIRQDHDLIDEPNAKSINIKKGDIYFDKVHFYYQKSRAVFHDLTVNIPGGQKVGLVGYSGSGKSTFVNLILRFYDIQSGHILIDKQDIAMVTQHSLRSQIALIPQDPVLFHRSLMENIRYGRLDATDEEVVEASKLAHCHEFIEKLDESYLSLVGERGIKLSGGQRQRIAIARAMLKQSPILILDEATSSLDSVTEKLIQESLNHLMEGKTTIIVAHRLSTLATMDRILVFHKGQIIEDGTKENLLAADGHFAKLWNMQTNGFLPEN